MLLAQRCIPPKWTHSSPPTHNKWIHEALRCITLEKITFSSKGLLDTVYKIWQLFSAYTDSLTISAETSNRHLTNRALPLLFIISFNSNTQCSKIVNTIIVSGDQPKGVCEGIYMWSKCVMIWVGWEGQRQSAHTHQLQLWWYGGVGKCSLHSFKTYSYEKTNCLQSVKQNWMNRYFK